MKTILTLAFLGQALSTYAQSVRYPLAMPYTGLAAYSTHQNDALSFTANQAALAQVKNAGAGICGEKRFLLANINVYALAAALPTQLGSFGIQVNYCGFKNFTENKIGLAYARGAGRKVDLGIQFNYYSYRIPGYGNATAVFAEAGAIFHISTKLNAGVHIYNPSGAKLGKTAGEKLAAAYKFALGYDASPDFFISTEIIKEEDKPVNVLAGVQYQFAKKFFARAGMLSETSAAFAGVGVSWKNFRADVAASYHPQLGVSPGVLLFINFENGKSNTKD